MAECINVVDSHPISPRPGTKWLWIAGHITMSATLHEQSFVTESQKKKHECNTRASQVISKMLREVLVQLD